jgi:ATP-dependent protease Clp ATPase subunit
MASPSEASAPVVRTCSWCGKPDGEVRLVAGPIANICEGCVRLACVILNIKIEPEETEPPEGSPPPG